MSVLAYRRFVWQDALELTRTHITPTVNRQGRVKRKPLDREQYGQKVQCGIWGGTGNGMVYVVWDAIRNGIV